MGRACFGSLGAHASAILAEAGSARKDPEMAYAPAQLGQDPQYEPFLHAPVGDDHRGTSVTVLSMLARLGVDPWGEASALAAMPDGAARQRLDALMSRFTDVPSVGPARTDAVSRLLACLPRPARNTPESRLSPSAVRTPAESLYWIVAIGLLLAYVGMQAHGN